MPNSNDFSGLPNADGLSRQTGREILAGEDAMTVAGMERIYKALTGRDFTAQERLDAQRKIDAQKYPVGQHSIPNTGESNHD